MNIPFLFKKHCLICTTAIAERASVCDLCVHKMQWLDSAELCPQCGIQLPQKTGRRCGSCLRSAPAFDEVHAIWAYDDLSGFLIRALKFHEDFSPLPFLVESMAKQLKAAYANRAFPEIVLPVPLHYTRLFRRGFNQANELGRHIATALSLPFDYQSLKKTRRTAVQSSLAFGERANNLKAAFKLAEKFPYRSVAICDDVITTGATINEIATVLKKAGVLEVHVWALARTMKNF